MPQFSPSFIAKIERSGIVDLVSTSMKIKDLQSLKKNSGTKASRVGLVVV